MTSDVPLRRDTTRRRALLVVTAIDAASLIQSTHTNHGDALRLARPRLLCFTLSSPSQRSVTLDEGPGHPHVAGAFGRTYAFRTGLNGSTSISLQAHPPLNRTGLVAAVDTADVGTERPLHSQGGRRQGGGSGSLGRVPLLAAVWASVTPRSSPVRQVGRPCDTPASGLRGTAPHYSARVWTDELPIPAKAPCLCVPGRRCRNHGDCSEPHHGWEELPCRSTPVRELVSCCFTDDLPLATWCSH